MRICSFDADCAKRIGVNKTVILQYLSDCLDSKASVVVVDGETWFTTTYDSIADRLVFMTKNIIKNNILALEKDGLIASIKLEKEAMDNTKSYRITELGKNIIKGL